MFGSQLDRLDKVESEISTTQRLLASSRSAESISLLNVLNSARGDLAARAEQAGEPKGESRDAA